LPHGRGDAFAGHPQRVQLLEGIRQVQIPGIGAPVFGVGACIGLEVVTM
jgi:hypothetical protein